MIDIHTHILFGVDHGSYTKSESIDLIQNAKKNGINHLFLTPHFNPIGDNCSTSKDVINNFIELQRDIFQRKIDISLYLGREIYSSKAIDKLLNEDTSLTLNYSKYVLLDFGYEKVDIDEYCYNLLIKGYIPIIAHPERYNYVTKEDYHKWRETGALIQVNSKSLISKRNISVNRKAKYLLNNDLIDFIASDTHHQQGNFKYLNKLYSKLEEKVITRIQTNARQIIESNNICVFF